MKKFLLGYKPNANLNDNNADSEEKKQANHQKMKRSSSIYDDYVKRHEQLISQIKKHGRK